MHGGVAAYAASIEHRQARLSIVMAAILLRRHALVELGLALAARVTGQILQQRGLRRLRLRLPWQREWLELGLLGLVHLLERDWARSSLARHA